MYAGTRWASNPTPNSHVVRAGRACALPFPSLLLSSAASTLFLMYAYIYIYRCVYVCLCLSDDCRGLHLRTLLSRVDDRVPLTASSSLLFSSAHYTDFSVHVLRVTHWKR